MRPLAPISADKKWLRDCAVSSGEEERLLPSLLEHLCEPYWALGRPERTAPEHAHMHCRMGCLDLAQGGVLLANEELKCDDVRALMFDNGYSPGLGAERCSSCILVLFFSLLQSSPSRTRCNHVGLAAMRMLRRASDRRSSRLPVTAMVPLLWISRCPLSGLWRCALRPSDQQVSAKRLNIKHLSAKFPPTLLRKKRASQHCCAAGDGSAEPERAAEPVRCPHSCSPAGS